MKVIDVMQKIANGEIPKKIMINDMLYTHDGVDYKRESDGEYLFNVFLETTTEDFNREVEIIEEDKKIEMLIIGKDDVAWCEGNMKTDEEMVDIVLDIKDKINEIIMVINEMREDK